MKNPEQPAPLFLLDFDGVIADTLDEAYQTNRQFIKELGLPPLTKETFRLMYKKNIHDAMKEYGVTKENFKNLWSMIKEREKRKVNKVFLYPSILTLLKKLRECHLYIITSSSTKAVESYLKRKKLFQYFQAVWGAEKGTSKVKKIKKILKKEKVTPQQAYFVTDTVGDVLEGKKAGVRIIAVGWGYHKKKELAETSPDYLFGTQKDLIKALPDL